MNIKIQVCMRLAVQYTPNKLLAFLIKFFNLVFNFQTMFLAARILPLNFYHFTACLDWFLACFNCCKIVYFSLRKLFLLSILRVDFELHVLVRVLVFIWEHFAHISLFFKDLLFWLTPCLLNLFLWDYNSLFLLCLYCTQW